MPDKIKVMFQGQPVEAAPVQVVSSQETFNTYLLEDGTTIKLKAVMLGVMKLEGPVDNEGNPVYLTRSQNVLDITVPKKRG